MANKLKIYACTGVGDINAERADKYYTFWTDKTDILSNTQAVNTLLAWINSLYIQVRYLANLSETEIIQRLNNIDLYVVCLDAARRFAGDDKALYKAGVVINSMIEKGYFKKNTTDEQEHSSHIAGLILNANKAYKSDIADSNSEFIEFWKNEIVARNKVGLSTEEQEKVREAENNLVSGIGVSDDWQKDKNVSNYLLNAALYFTYFYFTEAQLAKLPKVFTTKNKIQRKLYSYCKGYFVGVYGSAAEMDDIIRAGIIKEYGFTPEEVCAKIVSGDIKTPVGEAITLSATAIATIIAAAITAVTSIIVAIIACIRDVVSKKYEAVTAEQANKGCPNPEDFEGLDVESGAWGSETKDWLPLLAIGAAILLLLKR